MIKLFSRLLLFLSLDVQSQLRTMAYGWTHDVDGWSLLNRFYLMLYYPDRGYKRAVHLFRQEIQLTRGLLDALKTSAILSSKEFFTFILICAIKYRSF